MNQLVEAVLAVRSRLPEYDGSRWEFESITSKVDALTITFHVYLLNVGWEPCESLAIRQQSCARKFHEGSVPDSRQPHYNG